jgi:N4-gp56 family major capsid protein
LSTTPLVEGVTPTGRKLANQDYTVTLQQYGDFMTITDVIMDTHEDQVLQQATEVLGESAALTIETIRYNVLKAGTNVLYANGGQRDAVNTALTGAGGLTLQRQATTSLNRQNAKKITTVVASTPDFNTKSVEASYIAICHPDLESDIRGLTGFKPVADYGPHTTPFEGEVGSVEQVRYLLTTVATPFADAGGNKGTMRSTTGTKADVYPVLVIARDAYGIVPLKGKDSITPMVVNPKPVAGDPLAQRGTVGWKAWQNAVILNDAWMIRLEVGATA